MINVTLDATMFDLMQLCPQRYYYRFVLNKVTPTKAKPLDRGTLVHVGQEEYWKALKEGDAFNLRVQRAIQAVQQGSIDSDLDMDEVSRIIDVMRETFIVNRSLDEELEVLAVENPFAYSLYQDETVHIVMIGKIDLIVKDRKFDQPIVYDHKSYERDFPLKRLNNQFTNYAVAAETDYLVVNRIGFQTSVSPDKKHKRIFLSYDEPFKQQWKDNVVQVVYQYLDYISENKWPMNLTSCDKYNRLCEYFDICDTSGEAGKTFKLDTHFNTGEKWDVSAVLGDKK